MANVKLAVGAERVPDPADADRARIGIERWLAALTSCRASVDEIAAGQAIAGDAAGARILEGLFGNSSYLTLLAEQEPAFLVRVLVDGADAARERISADIVDAGGAAIDGRKPGGAAALGQAPAGAYHRHRRRV